MSPFSSDSVDRPNLRVTQALVELTAQLVHQCKNCHIYGHFSSLCYKMRDEYEKKRSLESRSPKAHHLQVGPVYTQDPICSQSEDLSSSNDLFNLQVQLKSTQVETKIPAPQHLITNLA